MGASARSGRACTGIRRGLVTFNRHCHWRERSGEWIVRAGSASIGVHAARSGRGDAERSDENLRKPLTSSRMARVRIGQRLANRAALLSRLRGSQIHIGVIWIRRDRNRTSGGGRRAGSAFRSSVNLRRTLLLRRGVFWC